MQTHGETTSEPELRVEIAGASFAPVAVEGRRHIFMLPQIQGALTLQSRYAVPSDDRPWVDDQRQLGVKVQRMTVSSTANGDPDHSDRPPGPWPWLVGHRERWRHARTLDQR